MPLSTNNKMNILLLLFLLFIVRPTIAAQPYKKGDCGNEQMAYGWSIFENATGKMQTAQGHRAFDCALRARLLQFQLSDLSITPSNKYMAKLPGTKKDAAIFVTAATADYFPALRALIGSIKRRYGRRQKMVVYDLGGIRKNAAMLNELKQICNLELRIFDFRQLPLQLWDVRNRAWKIIILARSFAEFGTFIYVDVSVRVTAGDYKWHFDQMNGRTLSPFQFVSPGTGHGVKKATASRTFDYLPMYLWHQNDTEMHQSNFIIVQRSEFTRKILKWALLCALTKDCWAPELFGAATGDDGQQRECPDAVFNGSIRETPLHICHQFDQSVLNILVQNAEAEEVSRGGNVELITHFSYNHPSRRFAIFPFINHEIKRTQWTNEKIAKKYTC